MKRFLLFQSILLAAFLLCRHLSFAQSGWFWQNTLPQGNTLTSVSFSDAHTGTAVGYLGRILRTTSDGITWTNQSSGTTNPVYGVSLGDAHVSSTNVSGVIAFYYVSGTEHGIWRARRNTDGSWSRGSKVLLNGVFNGNAVDPDVVRLDDGRYRLYYFLGTFVPPFPPSTGFYSAVSSDGINFTVEGKVFDLPNSTDPTVVRLPNGTYLLAVARHTQSMVENVLATSSDGRSFQTNGVVLSNGGIPELTLLADGSVRLFYNGPGGIVSRRSTDGGVTWSVEPGVRLSTSSFVADPSVIRTPDARWMMFVKGLNNTGVQGPRGHNVQLAESQDGVTFSLVSAVLLDSASVPEGLVLDLPPSAPTLVSPADGTTGVSTSPVLSWNASAGATTYRLQVSTISTFASTVFDDSTLTSTSKQVGPLMNNTTYFWRVSAKNAAGTSPFSSTRSFTTIVAAPAAPTLASPSDGATGVSTSPTLSWNASTGATSYRLQVSTSSGFSPLVVDQSGITGTSHQVSGLAHNTLYYWRVNATNAGGTSPYSSTWNFTTIVAAPAAPTLASPSDGTTGVSTSPTLSWNASTGATSYRLQVSTSSGFSPLVVDQGDITGTSHQVSGLAHNTLYYWRVNATNAGGTSSYSSTWNFTTTGPTSVEQLGSDVPTTYALYQNYPNPFNPTTTIRFSIPQRSHIMLKVFDVLGREVATLVDGELNPGEHSVVFSAKYLSSGIYFYRLTTPTFSQTKSMEVLK